MFLSKCFLLYCFQKGEFLKFLIDHPGYKHVVLQKRKTFIIPTIYDEKMVDFKDCFIDMEIVPSEPQNSEIVEKRERYAKSALFLFAHYRTIEDLQDEYGSFWSIFMKRHMDKSFFGEKVIKFSKICNIT